MMSKLRLDLAFALPELPDAADTCVHRLITDLQSHPGVEQVHVHPRTARLPGTPAELCIHYDGTKISLTRIREVIKASGGILSERFGHLLLRLERPPRARQARRLQEGLNAISGVLEARISATGQLRIEFDRQRISSQALQQALAGLGLPVAASSYTGSPGSAPYGDTAPGPDGKNHGALSGASSEMRCALASGALLALGAAMDAWLPAAPPWLAWACYAAAYFFGGLHTVREALENLRQRRFEIDTLMLVAAAGAAALGSWAEGALLLFLFSLGHALEHYAMGRARCAIEALAALAPDTATVRRDGQLVELSVEQLQVGDLVVVKPHERLAADGFVVQGVSSINQAPVTGESMPVDKRPVEDPAQARAYPGAVEAISRVFAGTINGSGALEIEVTRRATDSALARVVRMVSEAETRKSPTQRLTDRFERIFVPAVLLLATVLLFAWVVVDEPMRDSFYRAMAVLVAASPCALAIATPSAVLSGIARAARSGVLIKGGAPLETLGALQSMAFDKTGTLTEGRPRITEVRPAQGVSEQELLAVTIAAESLSDHPLASALVQDGRARLDAGTAIPAASGLRSMTGKGLAATVAGQPVLIGKAELFGSGGEAPLDASTARVIAGLRESGRTTLAVRMGGRDLGAIGMMDTPRASAQAALQQLRQLGISRMVMLSGDHAKVAEAVAQQVGITEAWGDLMPEDKVAAMRELRSQAQVAMVGDGVNDAPAMAHASVGVAMGAAGSDVALEAADVALMSDDLRHLPFAVGLSRKARAVIRQNVFVSLGVVAVLVPATIMGLGIGAAVAVHEGSTLLVVINALRLLAYRDPMPQAAKAQEAA